MTWKRSFFKCWKMSFTVFLEMLESREHANTPWLSPALTESEPHLTNQAVYQYNLRQIQTHKIGSTWSRVSRLQDSPMTLGLLDAEHSLKFIPNHIFFVIGQLVVSQSGINPANSSPVSVHLTLKMTLPTQSPCDLCYFLIYIPGPKANLVPMQYCMLRCCAEALFQGCVV